jgi:glycerol kinase
MSAMRADWPGSSNAKSVLRVDGGMTASDWTMQRLADILDAPVDRPSITETTALGAAYLAGLSAGLCPEPSEFMANWKLERRFTPSLQAHVRQRLIAGWQDAVRRTLS